MAKFTEKATDLKCPINVFQKLDVLNFHKNYVLFGVFTVSIYLWRMDKRIWTSVLERIQLSQTKAE